MPMLEITPHFVRSFENIFDNSDYGLIKYTTIMVSGVILIAVVLEIFRLITKRKKNMVGFKNEFSVCGDLEKLKQLKKIIEEHVDQKEKYIAMNKLLEQ